MQDYVAGCNNGGRFDHVHVQSCANNQKAGTVFRELYQFAEEHGITVVGGSDRTVGPSGGWVTASFSSSPLDPNRLMTILGREAVIVCSQITSVWEPIVCYNIVSSLRKGNILRPTLAKIPTSFTP